MSESSLTHAQVPGSIEPGDQRRRKAELRAQLLAARRARRPDPDAVAAVRAALLAILPRPTAAGAGPVVAAYAPFPTEPGGPDLPAVLATALRPTGRLLLPVVCDDRDLDWVVAPDSAGSTGPHLGRAAIGRAALVVVPALAVDHRGVRLGRGGGSYDRALARVPAGVPVVALLHDGELLAEELPAEPHDRPVSAVITPAQGLVRLSPAGWTAATARVHH